MAKALTKNSFALEASSAVAIVTCKVSRDDADGARFHSAKAYMHHCSCDERALLAVTVDLDLKRSQQQRFAFGHFAQTQKSI
jgi:hypothetical protein